MAAIQLLNRKIFRDILKLHPLRKSFSFAFQGILYLFLYHRNMRIIFLCGIAAVLSGVYLKFSRLEFILLLITVNVVFIAEMFNSAIELLIDKFIDKYHTLVKVIKDISAAVVLMACLNAAVVGYFLFRDKLVILFKK